MMLAFFFFCCRSQDSERSELRHNSLHKLLWQSPPLQSHVNVREIMLLTDQLELKIDTSWNCVFLSKTKNMIKQGKLVEV